MALLGSRSRKLGANPVVRDVPKAEPGEDALPNRGEVDRAPGPVVDVSIPSS